MQRTQLYLVIAMILPLISCQSGASLPALKKRQNAKRFLTVKNSTQQLSETDPVKFEPAAQPLETEVAVFVNPEKKFQEFIGIGGAITDASAEVFAKLTPQAQSELLAAYYNSEQGIGYTLARTSIHSCDFSSGSYIYVSENDSTLSSFSIAHDLRYRIPLIKRAAAETGENLRLYASPWSPPAFMKTNGEMLHGGKLKKEFYGTWARYYTRFIEAYEKEGVPVWGITIQNEPMAVQRWESCIYTAEEERDFLKNYLGPEMLKAGYGNRKIIIWDHNRDLITHRANVILSDPEAARYAWGVGFHWYETWAGGEPMFDNVAAVGDNFPDKKLLFTEGCAESFDSTHYQYWPNAERYGRSMINDFNRGTVGWTDWNILLDERGGPNHVQNFCFAPVHADTRSGKLIYTPSYYYIGHFSKFIRPGARRISTVSSRSHLLSTSFMNRDNSIVTVVMNPGDEAIDYDLYLGKQKLHLNSPARSIQTLVY